MLRLFLIICLIVAISSDHVDSGQYFKKISGENDVIADNVAFLNEEIFKCHRSQSCVISRRGVQNTETWEKVTKEPACKLLARFSKNLAILEGSYF